MKVVSSILFIAVAITTVPSGTQHAVPAFGNSQHTDLLLKDSMLRRV